MNNVLKLLMVVCVAGIVVVAGIALRADSTADSGPAALPLAPTLEISTTPPSGPVTEPEPSKVDEPTIDTSPAPSGTSSPAFQIVELTAECDAGEEFGVTALPLGTDWRITERGVYKNSPVTISCVTDGVTDSLTYDWSADEGEIEGSGPSIVWTAPDHGAKVQVSVMVRDSAGVEELAALHFRVATCECVYQRYA